MGTASHALGTARCAELDIRKVRLVRWHWCYAGLLLRCRTVPFPDYSGSNGLKFAMRPHF